MAAEAILYQTRYKDNMQGFSPWHFIKSWHCFIDMNKKQLLLSPHVLKAQSKFTSWQVSSYNKKRESQESFNSSWEVCEYAAVVSSFT